MAKESRRKKKINIKVLLAVLSAVVFVGAIVIYYVNSYNTTEREYAVYSAMEEPTFPVIHTVTDGMEINLMHGYLQDMGNEAAADSISVLQENRHLNITIDPYGMDIAGIEYEIKSLDLSHFIERTELTDYRKENGRIYAELPIQNLIEKDVQYLLKIKLKTGADEINYYTRICWPSENYVNQMLEMATSFTKKTFNYDEARELAAYLESNPKEKNDDLSLVTVGANFTQLTWGDTGMKLSSDLDVTIKQFDGIMYAIEINYETESESETGNTDRYQNTDEFTLRSGEERIYLMNYERKTNQIFEGNKHLFAGQRINLGIVNDENIDTKTSENKRFIAFVDNKELWLYDQDDKKAVNVFSFRSEKDKLRAGCQDHGIKILETGDDGNVDFAVYGYMNRGRHEGMNGIVYYSYSISEDTLTENLFIPVAKCYEKIKTEVDELCVKNNSAMFYLKQNGSIIAVDLTSLEIVDIASDMQKETYAVSSDQRKAAWVSEGSDKTSLVKVLDTETGLTQTIKGGKDEKLGVAGFQGRDLIYGISKKDEKWIVHGKELKTPYKKLIIVGENLQNVREYEKAGKYITEINVSENRIYFDLLKKSGGSNNFIKSGSDTLVSTDTGTGEENRKQTSISEQKKKIHHIVLDKALKTTKGLKIKAPEKISYENAGTIEITDGKTKEIQYCAYSNGVLCGVFSEFSRAVKCCYSEMGWVTDGNGMLLFNRANKTAFKTISEPNIAAQKLILEYKNYDGTGKIADDIIMLNANGLSYDMLLSYIYSDHPVMLLTDDGGYCLIYGYDNSSLKLYYPSGDDEKMSRKEKLSREDAEAYFAENKNDFVCFTDYRG